MDIAAELFFAQAVRAPVYLTLLVGIVFAIIRWSSHPRVSLMAVLGLSSLLLLSMVGRAAGGFLPRYLHTDRGMSIVQMGQVMVVWHITMSLLEAAGWVLVIIAVFGSRSPRANQGKTA